MTRSRLPTPDSRLPRPLVAAMQTMPKIFMPLGDATEAMDTFYPYYRLQEDGYEVAVAGPEARLYHTVLHEIPPDSNVPWDITQERPGYFIKAKSVERVVGADESLLGGVLRLFRRPQNGVGEAEGDVLVAAHELLIGTDVSAPGAFD